MTTLLSLRSIFCRYRKGCVASRASIVALLAVLGCAPTALDTPANAHAQLVSSSPEADSVIAAAPEEISLQFDGNLSEVGANIVSVVAPDGSAVDDGVPTISDATITQGLMPLSVYGTYTVTYRVVSSDGHVVNDSFSFQYQPASGNQSATAPESTPTAALLGSDTGTTSATGQHSNGGLRLSVGKIATIAVFAVVYLFVARWLKAYRRKSLGR